MNLEQTDIAKNDELIRKVIIERVLLGMFFIGLIQSVVTIFAHKSNPTTLIAILTLVPLVGFTYSYVRKTGKVKIVGRVLMYVAIPVLIYRAYTMGGIWGVTTNWIYLVPVFGALILGKREIIFLSFLATIMMIALAIAHNANPDYAMKNLLLVPAFSRVLYFMMPMYVISYVIIFYENQRKKFIEQIQEKTRQELQNEKLISIGSMTAGMAHEINNPLMVLQGSVNLIDSRLKKLELEEKDKVKFDRNVEKLKLGIQRITKIIESVKALSSNSETIEKEVIDVSQIISNSLVIFNDKLSMNGIRLIQTQNVRYPKIVGVQIQLEQILMNFISNSIDEVAGKENPWIKIMCDIDDKFCYFRVVDSGTGVNDIVIKQLFDPFFTTKEVGKGTGLGLSLCKTLAANNGGDIYYELFQGNTSFVLKVPI